MEGRLVGVNKHDVDANELDLPAGQVRHELPPNMLEYELTPQAVQADALLKDTYPAGHT